MESMVIWQNSIPILCEVVAASNKAQRRSNDFPVGARLNSVAKRELHPSLNREKKTGTHHTHHALAYKRWGDLAGQQSSHKRPVTLSTSPSQTLVPVRFRGGGQAQNNGSLPQKQFATEA